MLDIDYFKMINDIYGHAVGDQALMLIADLLSRYARPGDVVARYGGEEFCFLLPNTDEAGLRLGRSTSTSRCRQHFARRFT